MEYFWVPHIFVVFQIFFNMPFHKVLPTNCSHRDSFYDLQGFYFSDTKSKWRRLSIDDLSDFLWQFAGPICDIGVSIVTIENLYSNQIAKSFNL